MTSDLCGDEVCSAWTERGLPVKLKLSLSSGLVLHKAGVRTEVWASLLFSQTLRGFKVLKNSVSAHLTTGDSSPNFTYDQTYLWYSCIHLKQNLLLNHSVNRHNIGFKIKRSRETLTSAHWCKCVLLVWQLSSSILSVHGCVFSSLAALPLCSWILCLTAPQRIKDWAHSSLRSRVLHHKGQIFELKVFFRNDLYLWSAHDFIHVLKDVCFFILQQNIGWLKYYFNFKHFTHLHNTSDPDILCWLKTKYSIKYVIHQEKFLLFLAGMFFQWYCHAFMLIHGYHLFQTSYCVMGTV